MKKKERNLSCLHAPSIVLDNFHRYWKDDDRYEICLRAIESLLQIHGQWLFLLSGASQRRYDILQFAKLDKSFIRPFFNGVFTTRVRKLIMLMRPPFAI